MTWPRDLSELDDRQLEALSKFLRSHAGLSEVTPAHLASLALQLLWSAVAPLAATPRALAHAVESLRSDREKRRLTRVVDLVWSGQAERTGSARDTAEVLPELFRAATRRVFVASYAFHNASRLLQPLAGRMRERDLDVKILLNTWPRGHRDGSENTDPVQHARAFLRHSWPPHAPVPQLFAYHPHKTGQDQPPACMHAKCVLVDERYALIGSANFTESAQLTNLEIGVRVDDASFCRRVWAEWEGLIRRAEVRPIHLETSG